MGFRNSVRGVRPGSVGSDELADDSVTRPKLADLAVGTAEIDQLAVTSAKIADLAVTSAKIADLAVTNAKITGELVGKTITGGLFRTAASGDRWELSSGFANELRGYTAGTLAPGTVLTDWDGARQYVAVRSGRTNPNVSFESLIELHGAPGTAAGARDSLHLRASELFIDTLTAAGDVNFGGNGFSGGRAHFFDGIIGSSPGANGRQLNIWDFGSATCDGTTGRVIVAHNLAVTPTLIVVTPRGGAGYTVGVISRSSSSFDVDIIHRTGSRAAVTFDWWVAQ